VAISHHRPHQGINEAASKLIPRGKSMNKNPPMVMVSVVRGVYMTIFRQLLTPHCIGLWRVCLVPWRARWWRSYQLSVWRREETRGRRRGLSSDCLKHRALRKLLHDEGWATCRKDDMTTAFVWSKCAHIFISR
jgi:hypothetical protein